MLSNLIMCYDSLVLIPVSLLFFTPLFFLDHNVIPSPIFEIMIVLSVLAVLLVLASIAVVTIFCDTSLVLPEKNCLCASYNSFSMLCCFVKMISVGLTIAQFGMNASSGK